jgi:hypothetical protein
MKGSHFLASCEYLASKRKKSRISVVPGAVCKAGGSQKRYYTKISRPRLGPVSREYADPEELGLMKKVLNRPFG